MKPVLPLEFEASLTCDTSEPTAEETLRFFQAYCDIKNPVRQAEVYALLLQYAETSPERSLRLKTKH